MVLRPRFATVAHVFAPVVLSLLGGAHTARALQLANDPESYFGGPANDNKAYLEWANSIASHYDSSVYLPSTDPSKGAAVHWRIVDDEWLHIAVAARCTGWIGFGLSGAGGMLGSDMALFVSSRPSEIVDAHVIETLSPEPDDCQQDWILVDNDSDGADVAIKQASVDSEMSGFLAFEARRRLDTGDPQDWKIINDSVPSIPPHRIIAAWGDDPEVSQHGRNVARGAIRFFGAEDPHAAFEDAEGSFEMRATNYNIPSNDTTYEDFCWTRSDLLKKGVPDSTSELLNLIGFQPIVTPGSAPYVHHFTVHGSYDGSDNACEEDSEFDHFVYVWAPGDDGFALPDSLGVPLFGPDGFQSFHMEVHYDNPRLDTGIVDSSGVQFFYTSQPREFQVGTLELGDPHINLFAAKVGKGLTSHTFDCPGSCSSLYLNDEPVTVIREHLHMHQEGTRVTNELIRDGKVIRTASIEVWDFDQNGNAPVLQEPYQILPGDGFRTSCYYRGSDETLFGLSSRDEMCIAYLYYYPRKTFEIAENNMIHWFCGFGYDINFPACAEKYNQTSLAQDSFMNREFGESTCSNQDGPQQQGLEPTALAANTESASSSSSATLPLAVVAATTLCLVVFYF